MHIIFFCYNRWSEVTRRLELWIQILEINENGDFVPVEVVPARDVSTGGIFQLRQVGMPIYIISASHLADDYKACLMFKMLFLCVSTFLCPSRDSPGESRWKCGQSRTRAQCH